MSEILPVPMYEKVALIKCCSFGSNDYIEGQLMLKPNLHRMGNNGYWRTDNNFLTQNMSERMLKKRLLIDSGQRLSCSKKDSS